MIHNQAAFNRAQANTQADFDKKVSVTLFHLEGVLTKNDGRVIGESEDEVYAFLIADGVLGAMKSNRRIARAIKESRRDGTVLSTDDSYRFRDATEIVKKAVSQAVENGVVERFFQKKYVCLSLPALDFEFDIELEYADLGVYDRNHPLEYRLPGGALAKLGSYINE